MNVVHCGDCLEILKSMPDDSVDLALTSPPYENCRDYGVGFDLRGQEWVDWAVERFVECVRVSRGLVAWNVEGKTQKFRWSATPALLMADLHRRGINLRKPPIFARVGIPGSGGPDWLRNDYEFIVCATKGGRLPWSDNTAVGHAPKWAPGGAMSHRLHDGSRRDKWGGAGHASGGEGRRTDGQFKTRNKKQKLELGAKVHTKNDGSGMREQVYLPPVKANPGNIIRCRVGGGLMGSPYAHENEAPFPESLVRPFILSFCPPGGTVLDPFCGSGTTLAVAERTGRKWIGIDLRQSQVDLTLRRLREVTPEVAFTE